MKFSAIFLLFFVAQSVSAQDGYEIKVTLTPFKNQYVYLGYYYGREYAVVDSASLNEKSESIFKGQKKLGGGIYFITYPNHIIYFNLLIDKNQSFSITADTTQPSKIVFHSSPENTIYNSYLDSVKKLNEHLQALIKEAHTKDPDSARLIADYQKTDYAISSLRNNVVMKHPNSLLSMFIKASLDPVVPSNDAAQTDSLFAYKYFKEHYWDNVTFYDDRFLRTNFFEPKLDYYFNQLVYPSADSVEKETDWMLGYASINEEMQKFLLLYFFNRYTNQKHPWEDAVYLNLYEKYISNHTYPWLTPEVEKKISTKAYTIMASSEGKPASDIELPDESGEKISLYSIDAPFTLVVIWDPTCTHCKHDLPVMDSFYKAQWKAMGVKIFAMAIETDGTKNDWTSFIDKKNLNHDWINVYYSREDDKKRTDKGLLVYSKLYDVTGFPTLYLLDKDKHIIAKKISYKQVSDILLHIQKQKP